MGFGRFNRRVVLGGVLGATLMWSAEAAGFTEFLDPHPRLGNQFGQTVVALSTGNVVITSPGDDSVATDAGAVYLFNGASGALISILRGTTAGDQVGSGGVTALANGNYVVMSPLWDNGANTDAGAVTWGNGTFGVKGAVSPSNSLVGSHADDNVGVVTALSSGNYVVASQSWDNGAVFDAGAVTWGSGTTGVSGTISAGNSLVGSTASDQVGGGVVVLSNGNYVVMSPGWDNGAVVDVGAATWGSGTSGVSGTISVANSLIGSTASDLVGLGGGVSALTNGNYVVASPNWDNGVIADAGAATWGSGTTGVSGVISAANSLVGSKSSDLVGGGTVTALTNGNYVVKSPNWDNGAIANAGAVTWGSGTTGVSGAVSAANSLVGSTASDQVGSNGVTRLTNGNYVVMSPNWDGAFADVGAATWGSGTTGVSGAVSAANSLVGSTASDHVGGSVTALTNGNYVVASQSWDNVLIVDAGAVTWGNGTTGVSGAVSAANSLVGSTANDNVGDAVLALTNGSYLVRSMSWDNVAIPNAGAVTWGSGTTGISGAVAAANSLVGSTASDQVGSGGLRALTNGNYLVISSAWDRGGIANAGAVTWGNGTSGVSGAVSAANSLVGSTANDGVGSGAVALTNGNYVVMSTAWDNGGIANVGAVTWGNGTTGVSGPVSASNSLIGSTANDNVGSGVVALVNGNYVVRSPLWDSGSLTSAGAATWGNGVSTVSATVSAANSLVGSTANSSLQITIVEDGVNGTFCARFLAEGGGRVRVRRVDSVPRIASMRPASGGNSGPVTSTVSGDNLGSGATVKLTRGGQPDIPGTLVVVASDGQSLTATFDLTGKLAGPWNVVVTNPDLQSATLTNGFTIASLVPPMLRVDLAGQDNIRFGFAAAYDLVIQNPGNVDALAVPLWIAGIPSGATLSFGVTPTPLPVEGDEPTWSLVPNTLPSVTGNYYAALVIPRVPPGTTTRRIWLTIPMGGPSSFTLRAALTPPWVEGMRLRTCLVDGAVIANPSCMGMQLTAINAYLAGHPEIETINGIALWAKVAWHCELAPPPPPPTLNDAVAKAQQVLGLMVEPVEEQGTPPASCNDVLGVRWRDQLAVSVGGSFDPNDKLGEHANGGVISGQDYLPYTIDFENTGGFPAQHVTISDLLDSDLDPSRLIWQRVWIPNGHCDPSGSGYVAELPINPTLYVRVTTTRVDSHLLWSFDTYRYDNTALGPNDGFLPAGGMGSVQLSVPPNTGLSDGTEIRNWATVTFETSSQDTPTWINYVDNTPPHSHVTMVMPSPPNPGALSLTVIWAALPNSPDVKDYSVCVAEDTGPFREWRTSTTAISDTLGASSDHHPHTYAYYSVAQDQVGNMEPKGAADYSAQSQVAVDGPGRWALALEGARPNPAVGGSMHVSFTLADPAPAFLELIDIAGRRLLRVEVGSLGPGPHMLTLAARPQLRSGVYFLRLTHGTQVLHTRMVLMR